jgi:hypothetical protein
VIDDKPAQELLAEQVKQYGTDDDLVIDAVIVLAWRKSEDWDAKGTSTRYAAFALPGAPYHHTMGLLRHAVSMLDSRDADDDEDEQ